MMIPTYLMQKNDFGDCHRTALAKAWMVAILTAIPTPLASAVTCYSGIVGYLQMRRNARDKDKQ